MAFTAEQLAGNCSFLMSIRFLAGRTRGMFDAGPRLARLLASHQRWLLTQTAYALHLEYDPRDPTSGFTAVRLTGRITAHKVASRNTVLAFIEELYTYRFITHTPGDEPATTFRTGCCQPPGDVCLDSRQSRRARPARRR